MPANIVDHDKWNNAKSAAGKGASYALIMSIYKKMGGRFTHGGKDTAMSRALRGTHGK